MSELAADHRDAESRILLFLLGGNMAAAAIRASIPAAITSARCPIATAIPLVGLGTYRAYNDDCYKACMTALQCGYRLIDTAAVYRNETYVGQAIKDFLSASSTSVSQPAIESSASESKMESQMVTRRDLFITSKLHPRDMQSEQRAYEAGLASIQRLGLDYVDLYLLHWPGCGGVKLESLANREYRVAAWRGLERLQQEAKCRYIGVSNFTRTHLSDLLSVAKIRPVLNQVEFHPLLYQQDLLSYCHAEGVQLQAYSSIGQGSPRLLEHPVVIDIAKRLNQTPASVLFRWSLQHGVGIIPKSKTAERVRANAHVLDFELSPEDMTSLDALHDGTHFCWDPTRVA